MFHTESYCKLTNVFNLGRVLLFFADEDYNKRVNPVTEKKHFFSLFLRTSLSRGHSVTHRSVPTPRQKIFCHLKVQVFGNHSKIPRRNFLDRRPNTRHRLLCRVGKSLPTINRLYEKTISCLSCFCYKYF